MKKTLYLAGPINKCSDAEASDWREDTKLCLADYFQFADPMRRDYRGRELQAGIAHEIVTGDIEDITNSDVLLVYVPRPSIGTAMEVFYAFRILGKHVVVVHPEDKPSPWLIEHAHHIVRTFGEAFECLVGYADL